MIFPQFAARGPLMRHGWARMRDWTLLPVDGSSSEPSVALQLRNAVGDDPLWPHACVCTLTVSLLPQGLRMVLAVENTGSTAFSFQAALHSYFAVGEVTHASVIGVLPGEAILPLREPIDQVFEAVAAPVVLQSPTGRLQLDRVGFDDVVVWNPGPDTVLADLPADGYRAFVCVEPAAVAKPVALDAHARWEGVMRISYNRAHTSSET